MFNYKVQISTLILDSENREKDNAEITKKSGKFKYIVIGTVTAGIFVVVLALALYFTL